MNHRSTGIVCALAALMLDQSSKALALATPGLRDGIDILPMLQLVPINNDGVSFGILGRIAPWWGLAAFGCVVVIVLSVWLWRSHSTVLNVGLGLLIGGALGNIVDRVRFGAVTGFLEFYVVGYHWPAFNFADVAVVFGVAILLLDGLRPNKHATNGSQMRTGPESSDVARASQLKR
jgi:signal peptidase II